MAEESLQDKVAIVTGAGNPAGFGRSMTLTPVGTDTRVEVLDINEDLVEQSSKDAQEVGGF